MGFGVFILKSYILNALTSEKNAVFLPMPFCPNIVDTACTSVDADLSTYTVTIILHIAPLNGAVNTNTFSIVHIYRQNVMQV